MERGDKQRDRANAPDDTDNGINTEQEEQENPFSAHFFERDKTSRCREQLHPR